MPKTQTAFHANVCGRDEFVELSPDARALYLHLGFEADNIGEVVGVRRLARGFNVSPDALGELLAAGWLLEIEGRCFITHYRMNNRKPTNERTLDATARLWKNRPEGLGYAGELYASPLVRLTLDERSPNVFAEPEPEPNRMEQNPNPTESKENANRKGEGVQGRGETYPSVIVCPGCGMELEPGACVCANCGVPL